MLTVTPSLQSSFPFAVFTRLNDQISKESTLYPTMANENRWSKNIHKNGTPLAQHDNFRSFGVLFVLKAPFNTVVHDIHNT